MCFGGENDLQALETAYARVQQSMRKALADAEVSASATSPEPYDLTPVLNEWVAFLQDVQTAQNRWSSRPEERKAVSVSIGQLVSLRAATANAQASGVQDVKAMARTRVAFENEIRAIDDNVTVALNGVAGQTIAAGGPGMFVSLCTENRERRYSIELNVGDWRSLDNANNDRFSAHNSIRLITVMPSVTWSVFRNKNHDYLDLGMAAGYYAFSSNGFDKVNGFIWEPLRIDFHAPSSWASHPRTDIRRVVSMFTLRLGWMSIPGGLPVGSFAPGSHDRDISTELVPTMGAFFNLNSLFANPRKKTFQSTITP